MTVLISEEELQDLLGCSRSTVLVRAKSVTGESDLQRKTYYEMSEEAMELIRTHSEDLKVIGHRVKRSCWIRTDVCDEDERVILWAYIGVNGVPESFRWKSWRKPGQSDPEMLSVEFGSAQEAIASLMGEGPIPFRMVRAEAKTGGE